MKKRTGHDRSSIISSDTFIPFSVINLRNRDQGLELRRETEGDFWRTDHPAPPLSPSTLLEPRITRDQLLQDRMQLDLRS